MSVIGAISILDTESVPNTGLNIFYYIFLPLLAYIIVLFISTIAFRGYLILFCDYFLYPHEEGENLDHDQSQVNVVDIESQNSRENKTNTFQKISDTLFVKGNKRDKKRFERYLKEKEENKTSITNQNEEKIRDQRFSKTGIDFNQTAIHQKAFSFNCRNKSMPNINSDKDLKNQNFHSQNYDQPLNYVAQINESKKEDRIRVNKSQRNFLKSKPGKNSSRFYFAPKQNTKSKIALSCKSVNHKCTICFENISNSVLMNCGHGGICCNCACTAFKIDNRCIFCRNTISCILQLEPPQHNMNLIKILNITVLEKDNEAAKIEEIIEMLNNCDVDCSNGYYSDGESQSYTPRNHQEIDSLGSSILDSHRMSKRNNSCTNLENPFVKHNTVKAFVVTPQNDKKIS